MTYDYCIVDSANLFYRLKKNSKNSLDTVKKMINFVDGEIKSHLKKDGIIYILFDPVSYSDLGESKNFYYGLGERKKILPDYKANRAYSAIYLETIELFRKYYLYRGDKIKLIYSDEYEADDFIDPLIKHIHDKHKLESRGLAVALCTTDYDWCGYIEEKGGRIVHVINSGFDKPFTRTEFEKLFQFKPTPAANIIYKAFFGDKSDNIIGAIHVKKSKFNNNIKILCRDYLKKIAEENLTLDEVLNQFKTTSLRDIQSKIEKNEFENLFSTLSIADLRSPIFEHFYRNINILKSMLADKDIERFIHSNAENKSINDIIHKSIYGIPFKQTFGKT